MGNALAKQVSSQLGGVLGLSTVSLFEYSVTFAGKAQVDMNFDCSSNLAASTLNLSLRSLSAVANLAERASNGSTLPFRDVSASASENRVHLTLETAIP